LHEFEAAVTWCHKKELKIKFFKNRERVSGVDVIALGENFVHHDKTKCLGFTSSRVSELEGHGYGALAGTWTDPKRRLEMGEYLGLFLFGQLNPVVDSMQDLCAASQFRRVQEQVCGSAVSLGSFSEAQALVEPQLLERVFENLVSQCARKPQKGLEGRELPAIESTL
jgi:hypothetical protein